MDPIWYFIYIYSIVIFFVSITLGYFSQRITMKTFDKFSKIRSICGVTAVDFTTILLGKAGITDVRIVKIDGKLTDCYDPRNKIVRLSKSTVDSNSLAALGVCAHEVGHAVQHHNHNWLFVTRIKMVPVMNIFSKAFIPLVLVGSLLSFSAGLPDIGKYVLLFSTITYGLSFLFYLVTLPLEFDASRRAAKMMHDCDFLVPEEVTAAKKVLNAAIWTYISALVTSLLYFVKFLLYSRIFDRN